MMATKEGNMFINGPIILSAEFNQECMFFSVARVLG
jgi:hypothetical protein